jgi:hypothetical protein
VIELGCDLSDFLVEVAYEPRFLLAAAAFGSGSRWAPGPEFVEALAGRAYFRIVDLGDSRLTEVGRWTFDPVSGAA